MLFILKYKQKKKFTPIIHINMKVFFLFALTLSYTYHIGIATYFLYKSKSEVNLQMFNQLQFLG